MALVKANGGESKGLVSEYYEEYTKFPQFESSSLEVKSGIIIFKVVSWTL